MEEINTAFESPEYWSPSVQLRWLEREHCLYEGKEKALQQLWTSNLGKLEWRDVETIIEE